MPKPDLTKIETRFYTVDDAEQAKTLVKAIPVFVAPERWTAKDSSAVIHAVDNTLVVRQTVYGFSPNGGTTARGSNGQRPQARRTR